jgi:DNA-binding response OmpR family regulator
MGALSIFRGGGRSADGPQVIAEAGTLKEAIEVARVADFDLAILDLRLGDETTELVAEITRGRGLPFFFLTSHTSDGLSVGFRNVPDWRSRFSAPHSGR